MKIVIIHPNLGLGGAERLMLDIALSLQSQKHEVQFLTNHFNEKHAFEELSNEENESNIEITVMGSWIPGNIFGKFHAILAYWKILYLTMFYMFVYYLFEKPNLFIVDQIPIANIILKIFKQNVIYYCHHPDLLSSNHNGTLRRIYRNPIDYLEQKSMGYADKILVNSKYTADVVKSTFPNLKQELIIFYPTVSKNHLNIIKQRHCDLDELYPQIIYKNNFIFLCVSRFHPFKNLELAILAFNYLQNTLKETKTNLVISGGYDDECNINIEYYYKLDNLTKEKEIDNVFFIRSPTDLLKSDLYNICHCVLYTTVFEHFGIVPLEAMAAFKPVIACNNGGPREIIEHNKTGFLAEPTPEDFAKYMQRMLNRKVAEQMGIEGHKLLFEKFSPDVFDEQLKNVVDYTNKINK